MAAKHNGELKESPRTLEPQQEQMLIGLRDEVMYFERRRQEAQHNLDMALNSLQAAGFRLSAALVSAPPTPQGEKQPSNG